MGRRRQFSDPDDWMGREVRQEFNGRSRFTGDEMLTIDRFWSRMAGVFRRHVERLYQNDVGETRRTFQSRDEVQAWSEDALFGVHASVMQAIEEGQDIKVWDIEFDTSPAAETDILTASAEPTSPRKSTPDVSGGE